MKLLKSLLILLVVLSLVSCNLFNQGSAITDVVLDVTTSSTTSGKVDTQAPPIDFDPDMDVTEKPTEDPYKNIDIEEFYANYKPAESYWDAYYRTINFLMSGSIDEQDQEPTLAENQPKENGLYIRNTSALYSSDGNIYYVIDSNVNILPKDYHRALSFYLTCS